jgi:hypothetical protein
MFVIHQPARHINRSRRRSSAAAENYFIAASHIFPRRTKVVRQTADLPDKKGRLAPAFSYDFAILLR